jgi:transcriptional regulator with XRE-family HTH domain
MTIGEKVKVFRVKHLLTLREAADLLGVSYAEVDRIEKEKHKPQLITEAKWEKKLQDAEEALKNE